MLAGNSKEVTYEKAIQNKDLYQNSKIYELKKQKEVLENVKENTFSDDEVRSKNNEGISLK